MRKIYGVLLGLMVGVFAVMLTGCTPKVDISEFITIECSGASGYGSVSAEVKEKELILEIFGDDTEEKIEKASDISKYTEMLKGMEAVSNIKVNLDKSENVSNGDKIKVTVTISDEDKDAIPASFTNLEYEYTVEGLKEAKKIDPFAEDVMRVEYQGVSPDSTLSVTNVASESAIRAISYSLEERSGLKNGDTVKIKAEYDEEDLLEEGYVVTPEETSYTVANPYKYVEASSEIPADLDKKMETQALDVVQAYSAQVNVKKTKWSLVGKYVLVNKSDQIGYGDAHCRVYYVYKATVVPKNKEYKKKTVFVPVRYDDVVIGEGGTTTYVPSEHARREYDSGNPFAIDSWWSYFECYEKEQTMFDDLITKQTDRYTYEVSGSLKDLK